MRCLAVVEARMGSTRFPGKVLAPLVGMPVLQHLGKRLATCPVLERVVLATSTLQRDDVLAKAGSTFGFEVIRGPEDNLLARHLLVLERYAPEIIVRITGDCPLADPDVIARLVTLLEDTGADYATVRSGTPCIHQGIDPFRTTVLRRLAAEHGHDPYVQEHVVSWLKAHPDYASIAYLELPERERLGGARISVDTPADLAFLEAVYASLGAAPGEADIRDVADLLRAQPWLLNINAHVRQKLAGAPTLRIVITCAEDADAEFLAAVASTLRDVHGVGVRVHAGPARTIPAALRIFAKVDDPRDFEPQVLVAADPACPVLVGIPTVRLSRGEGTMHFNPADAMQLSPVRTSRDTAGAQAAAAFLAQCARQCCEAAC